MPAFVLASMLLLLVDNFTYTVLQFGIITSQGIWRAAYMALFLLFLVLSYRYQASLEKRAASSRLLDFKSVLAAALALTTLVWTCLQLSDQEFQPRRPAPDPPP